MNLRIWIVLLVLLFTTTGDSLPAQSEPQTFDLQLSGSLVGKLEPQTELVASTLGFSKERPTRTRTAKIEDLPLKLPVDQFHDELVRVQFFSPTQKKKLFSMELSRSLFDKPRTIKLQLNKPRLSLRTISDWTTVRMTPSVSQRMRYMDLPYWNEQEQKLVPYPHAPKLEITGTKSNQVFEMNDFCMGAKWYVKIPANLSPTKDTKIVYSVEYDSGGAFETVKSSFEYDYRVAQHIER